MEEEKKSKSNINFDILNLRSCYNAVWKVVLKSEEKTLASQKKENDWTSLNRYKA